MKAMPEHPNRGSSFEDFLEEEGTLEASTATAVKRVLAWQIAEAMRTQHLTKSAMAARMHTSRSQLERLLDPEKTGVSLETIQRAAAVVGRELRVELVQAGVLPALLEQNLRRELSRSCSTSTAAPNRLAIHVAGFLPCPFLSFRTVDRSALADGFPCCNTAFFCSLEV
jgi:antitoxin HicB